MTTETIGGRIKRHREETAKLNREQLGVAVGVSRQAVKKWEDGDTQNMKLGNLMKLCSIFRVSAEELITGSAPIAQYENNRGVVHFVAQPTAPLYNGRNKDITEIVSIIESLSDKGIGYMRHAADEAARLFANKEKGAAS